MAKTTKWSGDFLYVEIEDGIEIIDYLGNKQLVEIPEELDGKPVVVVGSRDRGASTSKVIKLVIPRNVRKIAMEALVFGTSRHWICGLFIDDLNPYLSVKDQLLLSKDEKKIIFYLGNHDIESFKIPEGIEIIGTHAFDGMHMKSVILPSTLKEIQESAFIHTGLEVVQIPEGVIKICDYAFYGGCTSIILTGDTELGMNVAQEIKLGCPSAKYRVEDCLLITADGKRILKYVGAGNHSKIQISDVVEKIDDEAFLKACKLERIEFNKKLRYIGKAAFRATQLDSVEIPASVEYMAPDAFSEQRPRTEVTFESENKSYRSDGIALYHRLENGCEEISKILDKTIAEFLVPETVKELRGEVFKGCAKLTKLILQEGLLEFDEHGLYEYYNGSNVRQVKIPASVKRLSFVGRQYGKGGHIKYIINEENERYFIDDGLLYEVNGEDNYTLLFSQNPKCRQVEILEGTKRIAGWAFSPENAPKCEKLTTVIFPNTIRVIEENAFSRTGIKKLVLPNGLVSVLSEAFSDCLELTAVKIPSSLEHITDSAFKGCAKLEEFIVEEGNPFFCTEDGVLFNADKTRLICYPAGKKEKEYIVPEGVEHIGTAFAWTRNLQKLTLPSTLKHIYGDAFLKCKVKDVYFCADIEEIDSDAFDRSGEPIYLHADSKSKIARYVLEERRANYNINYKNIHLVDDNEPFEIRNLKEKYDFIDVEDGIGIFGYQGEDVYLEFPTRVGDMPVVELCSGIFTNGISGNKTIEEIVIPEGIKRINAESLYNLIKLKRVVFPRSVEYISDLVFSYRNGGYKDGVRISMIVYVVEEGSYAESFLKNYGLTYNLGQLTIVYKDQVYPY